MVLAACLAGPAASSSPDCRGCVITAQVLGGDSDSIVGLDQFGKERVIDISRPREGERISEEHIGPISAGGRVRIGNSAYDVLDTGNTIKIGRNGETFRLPNGEFFVVNGYVVELTAESRVRRVIGAGQLSRD